MELIHINQTIGELFYFNLCSYLLCTQTLCLNMLRQALLQAKIDFVFIIWEGEGGYLIKR